MYSLASVKPGLTIEIDEEPYIVTGAIHSKQARGGAVLKSTMKSLLTGSTIQKTFQGSDKLKPADVNYKKSQYLYADGDDYHFMRNDNYEQFSLEKNILGEKTNYLVEGTDVDIQMFGERPINVNLPPKINLKVTHTEPGVRGDTASGGSKPATLETGKVLQVPLFVDIDDTIRVNTETGEYTERVK